MSLEEKDLEAVKIDSEVTSTTSEKFQDLQPTPSDSPADPLNWPAWKKNVVLYIASIHAMQGPFTAALVIPSFQLFAEEFRLTLTQATYIASIQIICLGVFPLFWSPLASRIGRRPIYLISALGSAVFTLAAGFVHSYGALLAVRALQAAFISVAMSLGGSTVNDMFFAHEKGRKMGVWVLFVTLSPCVGPLVVGYLVQKHGWRSSFYLAAPIHLALFFAHLFFAPETLYLNRRAPGEGYDPKEVEEQQGWSSYFVFKIIDPAPLTLLDFCRPLLMVFRPLVALPALAYAINFAYTNVLMTILIPQVYGEKFHFGPGQISLQFIPLIIGSVLGEQLAGYGSDVIANWRTRRVGRRIPEFRLALAVPGFAISIIGVVVWGIQLQNAKPGKWNVTPDVASAIGLFGEQVVATVCVTYAIENYVPETLDVAAFFAFVRQAYAFGAPFYFSPMYIRYGDTKASGLLAGIIAIAFLMVMSCYILGPMVRNRK
ncbi:MFS multidrug transporter [Mycena sanguinolenta]|uniref:MFS multidrug transporter n=1 Tax=Mycena sanguinolenta TaxID=230812 RepID=A0A8H7D3Q7_9AGAR|nr:MFS multidrug transporter [Mycena sanguinolenta]